ncbi:MAG: hypothetical protein M5T52_17430 [Ignavibacteriaceae bacterium]|nr:hypothetical protein [Ignavibacteriaceae bacterium]
MFKRFLLLFVIIFNLSMYSQVIIKDEIYLSDSSVMQENTDNPVMYWFSGKWNFWLVK